MSLKRDADAKGKLTILVTWVPVEDSKPAIGEPVLFAIRGQGLPEMGMWRSDDHNWQSVECDAYAMPIFFDEGQVTHWMRIPNTPDE
jgi:hypothetical protein